MQTLMKYLLIASTIIVLGFSCTLTDTTSVGSGDAISGSITKFKVVNDFLYVIDGSSLRTFSLDDPAHPTDHKTTEIGFGPETLFALGDILFVGAQTGMYMFSIANPGAPSLISQYEHVLSCDPVVANSSRAYVTLRSGVECRGRRISIANELHTIDITIAQHPQLMAAYPMQHPKGLGLNGDLLFVCDGDRGVIIFKVNEHGIPEEHSRIPGIEALDVIANQSKLIVITRDQILQYDYSEINDIKLLSALEHGA